MAEKQNFYESGCSDCPSHMVCGVSRYCAGFKNKSRRKPFRKSDPSYKAPKWCPKRKVPSEYRVYGFADENSRLMSSFFNSDAHSERSHISVMDSHYCLRASGTVSSNIKEFYNNANDPSVECLLEQEEIADGEIVEINTGLAQYFFYCVHSHDYRKVYFNPARCKPRQEENGG